MDEEVLTETPAETIDALLGSLDLITEEGMVFGWAWSPGRPDEKIEVELLLDGLPAGSAKAALYRADVAAAGIGDGYCGFSWPLPYAALATPRDIQITARDKQSGRDLPGHQVFRQRSVHDALRKINMLEDEVRLLQATIGELTRRTRQEDQASAELFRTVGAFFSELAALAAAGESPGQLRSVRAAIADITRDFSAFAFPAVAEPEFSVFVMAAGSVASVHARLLRLHETLDDAPAEILLLDAGGAEDAALLPLVIQNLRYVRLGEQESAPARINAAMRLARGKLAVFLGEGVSPAPFWTGALAAFEHEPNLAAMAGPVTDGDGLLISAGFLIQDGRPVPRGQAMPLRGSEFEQPGPVDSVAPEFFVLRQALWAQCGGLDEGFLSAAGALADFCARVAAAGGLVRYEPTFEATAV